MSLKDNVQEILKKQKNLLVEFEALASQYNADEALKQNEVLRLEVEKCKNELEKLNKERKILAEENQGLKISLKEQILNEKLNIIKISKAKTEAYFRKSIGEEKNKLRAVEKGLKLKIDELHRICETELIKDKVEFHAQVEEQYKLLKDKINRQKQGISNYQEKITEKIKNDYEALNNEELDEEIIQERIKQNNVEVKIGLSLINKVGILLILLGTATAVKYSYSMWFNNHMRGIFTFLLGIAFLGAGEWFSKNEKTIFSIGLNGGGNAILYYAVFSSYFFLKILNLKVALILSIVVTIITTLSALRYNSETICSFALVGGYLPFFSYVFAFGLDTSGIYGSMIYLFLLNSSLLVISLFKKWNFTNYLSFLLNVPVMFYLILQCDNNYINILYSLLTFILYLAITLIYSLKNRTEIKFVNLFLLGLNTFLSCTTTYWLFERANLQSLKGLLAILFSIIYFSLGKFVEKQMEEEKKSRLLFYITSITFAALVIPFQFGVAWLTIGWTFESVLMIIYGVKENSSLLEKAGWTLFGVCCGAFYLFDFPWTAEFLSYEPKHQHLKYFLIIASMIGILYMYLKNTKEDTLFKFSTKGKLINYFKYFSTVNLWIYLFHEAGILYDNYFTPSYLQTYYRILIFAAITGIVAYLIKKIELINDKMMEYFSNFLNVVVVLVCIITNCFIKVFYSGGSISFIGFSFVLLTIFNIISFFTLKNMIIKIGLNDNKWNFEFSILLLCFYIGFNVRNFLIFQFSFQNINFIISFTYMIFSFLFIIYGFKQNYVYLRRAGLGLTIFANAKLFIFDLAYLTILWKIAAYFCFGFIMIAISYIYQQLKRMTEHEKE